MLLPTHFQRKKDDLIYGSNNFPLKIVFKNKSSSFYFLVGHIHSVQHWSKVKAFVTIIVLELCDKSNLEQSTLKNSWQESFISNVGRVNQRGKKQIRKPFKKLFIHFF